eukprot:403365991
MKNIDFRQLETHLQKFFKPTSTTNLSRKLLLVRSAESQGNLSGTITGWMDVRLSDFGRKQAFRISDVLVKHQQQFASIHSSDLQRCMDTAFYGLAFTSDSELIKNSPKLREMNFGAHEGLHYDGLSKEEKVKLSDPEYQAPNGESWPQVKQRATEYFSTFGVGNHLVFTHGGLITSYLHHAGVTQMPNNCSFVGLSLQNDKSKDLGALKELEFVWEFPNIEEDI